MSSSDAAPSLADRLVAACYNGVLPSAKAAVADGASVNEKGEAPWGGTDLALAAAVTNNHGDVVVWLLSHGADPNGDKVMTRGAYYCTAGMLQLLIDAGGDVNRSGGGGHLPLFAAVQGNNSEDNVRVLLAQPSLDFNIKTYDGDTPEQFARENYRPEVADMIAQEVSKNGLPGLLPAASADFVWLLWLTDRETSDAGTTTALLV